jgi:hypothetical protein
MSRHKQLLDDKIGNNCIKPLPVIVATSLLENWVAEAQPTGHMQAKL